MEEPIQQQTYIASFEHGYESQKEAGSGYSYWTTPMIPAFLSSLWMVLGVPGMKNDASTSSLHVNMVLYS